MRLKATRLVRPVMGLVRISTGACTVSPGRGAEPGGYNFLFKSQHELAPLAHLRRVAIFVNR